MENVNPVIEIETVISPLLNTNKVGDRVFSLRNTKILDFMQCVAMDAIMLLIKQHAISCNDLVWTLDLAGGFEEIERRGIEYDLVQIEMKTKGQNLAVLAISKDQALEAIEYCKVKAGGYVDVDTVPMNPGSDMKN